MPNYQPQSHGARMSFDYLEAAAAAPIQRAMLNTFELYHPLSGRHRFVNDNVDFFATLEATAPAGAGTVVQWTAAPVSINKPDQSDTASSPQISLSLDNVAGIMAVELKKTRGSLVPWQLTERVYASDNTSGPAVLPPTVLYLASVDMVDDYLSIKASFGDPSNVSVPTLTFTRALYPGLVR